MERIFTMLSSCLLVFLVTLCHSYKILVYNPKFGHSNVNFYGNVADILVEAGHDVVSFTLIEYYLVFLLIKKSKVIFFYLDNAHHGPASK